MLAKNLTAANPDLIGEIKMTDHSPDPANSNEAELMARYEITRVPTEHFLYKTYKYTNLADAVAQAKRDKSPS